MIFPPEQSKTRLWHWMIAFSLAYAVVHFGCIGLGHLFKVYPDNIATFWPASGLLMAALLCSEYRWWPAILLGFVVAEQTADFIYATSQFDVALHTLYKIGNGVEGFLGAYLVRRYVYPEVKFSHVNYVIGFSLITIFVSIPLGALIGAGANKLTNPATDFWQSWEFWYEADLLGVLIITPVFIVWSQAPWRYLATAKRWELVELAVASLMTILLSLYIFSSRPSEVYEVFELPYVLYPLLVWMALRFHRSVSVLAALYIAVVAIWFTHSGHGPFYTSAIAEQRHFFELKAFLILTSLFTLFLTAAMSERRHAQQQLSEQERKLSTLMSNLPGMVYRGQYTDRRVMEFVSAGCKALTGYEVDDLSGINGNSYDELVHRDDKEMIAKGLAQALQQSRPFHLSYRIQAADGRQKWVLEQGQAVYAGRRRQLYIEGFVTDTTEQKKAEQALVESEERYRRFIETSVEGIWRMEYREPIDITLPVDEQVERIYAQGYHAEVNDVYLQQYGFSSGAEAMRSTLNDIAPKSDQRNWDLQTRFVSGGYRLTNELSYEIDCRGDNKIFLVNIAGIVEDGCLVRSWGMQIDVTEQKQFEEEQHKLQMQVQQLQKHEALGVLASGIAHDFNNILTGSLGFAELALARTDPGDRVHYYLEQIRQSGERARDLVAQILTFSRPERGKRALVKISQVLDEALLFLKASLPDSITIVHNIDHNDSFVFADSSQIYQVIINLCTNASQAMPDGGRLMLSLDRISLINYMYAMTGRVPPGDYMRLRIEDTGVGMDADVVARIFDPFFTTKPTGTGLGLSVVLGIVNSHNGLINVASTPGMGTRIEVYVPFSEKEVASVAVAGRSMAQKGRGQRILVVDDDALVARIAEEMLLELNYRVDVYTSSVQARSVFQASPEQYDLLLTDWTMPEMNGLALSRELKRLRPELPIVLMTGETAELPAGSQPLLIEKVLHKPLSLTVLAAALAEVLVLSGDA